MSDLDGLLQDILKDLQARPEGTRIGFSEGSIDIWYYEGDILQVRSYVVENTARDRIRQMLDQRSRL